MPLRVWGRLADLFKAQDLKVFHLHAPRKLFNEGSGLAVRKHWRAAQEAPDVHEFKQDAVILLIAWRRGHWRRNETAKDAAPEGNEKFPVSLELKYYRGSRFEPLLSQSIQNTFRLDFQVGVRKKAFSLILDKKDAPVTT